MQVAHLLRKCNPSEWGGTETAVKRLLDGLASHGASSVVFSPKLARPISEDSFQRSGHSVRRFNAFLPVLGISNGQREQLVAVGGNLMSFDLIWRLGVEPGVDVIHSHTLNRLGSVASLVACARRCPFVVTIHGGFFDLPAGVSARLVEPLRGGLEWGKVLGFALGSRKVVARADGVVTCNRREAEMISSKYPAKPVLVQPHGVPLPLYQCDRRTAALAAFPDLAQRTILLCAGRIDPVKNQSWLVEQLPLVIQRHPNVMLVAAGPCTDDGYGKALRKQIYAAGLDQRVLFTGGMMPEDARLIGLFQCAAALVLPSLSETFGLVVLEAWAAGRPVIATRTSGTAELIRDQHNGWLFDLSDPGGFHRAVDCCVNHPQQSASLGLNGQKLVAELYDTHALAGRMRQFYDSLLRHRKR